jgi:hypothetical protein
MTAIEGQPRAVIAHAAEQIRAVRRIAGGAPVLFLSAPGAAGFLGLAGWRAMLEAGGAAGQGVLDAADAPGHALAALRAGFRLVALNARLRAFAALAELFAAQGALLLPEPPPALDLGRVDLVKPQGRAHLLGWLGLVGPGFPDPGKWPSDPRDCSRLPRKDAP